METALSNYEWNEGQYRPVSFRTNNKPVSFTPIVLTRERSKVIPADPDQCLICGFYFDHYREGKAGLCGRCVLKGLPDSIKVIIEDDFKGKKVVSYYRPNIIDKLKTGGEENGEGERKTISKVRDGRDDLRVSGIGKKSIKLSASELKVSLR
ncbi:MAG: hypothetical protein ABIN18_14425 [Pseudomonadota bacterium]